MSAAQDGAGPRCPQPLRAASPLTGPARAPTGRARPRHLPLSPRAALPGPGQTRRANTGEGGSVTKREPRGSPAKVGAPRPALLHPPPPPPRDLPAPTSLFPPGRVGGKAHPKGAANLRRPAPRSRSPPPVSGRLPFPQPPRCPPSRSREPRRPRPLCSRMPAAAHLAPGDRPSRPCCPVRPVRAVLRYAVPSCPVPSVPPRRSLSTGHSRRAGGPGSWDSHWTGGGGRRGRCREKPREAGAAAAGRASRERPRRPSARRARRPRPRPRPLPPRGPAGAGAVPALRQRLGREAGPASSAWDRAWGHRVAAHNQLGGKN